MKKIKLLFRLFLNLVLYSFSSFMPKKDNLWVFGAWFGTRYSDNPKAFFEYININEKSITAVWITKDSEVIKQVQVLGYKVYNEKSLKGIWYQLRAQFAFICQALPDDLFSPCIGNKTQVVNLWHGLPLKKIMFDVFGDNKIEKNSIGRFVDFISPYNNHRNDYIVATSKYTQKLLSQAFRIDEKRTLITGFPRNDVFFKEKHKKIKNQKFKCIYMPTFRGGIGSECDLFEKYGFEFDQIEKLLFQNNIELTLRMHPVNRPPNEIVQLIKKSKNMCIDSSDDVYSNIADYDCLITDYSSIYFDFLLSQKTIIFAPFDLEHYMLNERSLYFDYSEVTLPPYCMSWLSVIKRITDIKDNNCSAEYNENYKNLYSRFHSVTTTGKHPFSKQLFKAITNFI